MHHRKSDHRKKLGHKVTRIEAKTIWNQIIQSQEHCMPWENICFEQITQECFLANSSSSNNSPLFGQTFGVKDNLDVMAYPTTCGSPLYFECFPCFDSSCVSLLRQVGAIPVGKTVTAEFAYRRPGPTLNPWSKKYSPGGSSSGSAAVVACGAVDFALGTQTGGSIIRPAAYCGVFGFKPSRGLIHRGGLHLLSDTLDTIGWFARSLEQIQMVGEVLMPNIVSAQKNKSNTKLPNLLVIRAECLSKMDACAVEVMNVAIEALRSNGIGIKEFKLEAELLLLSKCHSIIMGYELSRGLHPEYSSNPKALSKELTYAIQSGKLISNVDYLSAITETKSVEEKLMMCMSDCDVIMTPSASGVAPLGLSNTGSSAFNKVWSLLGWPAIHIPTAYGPGQLPLGFQLIGQPKQDNNLLTFAKTIHVISDKRAGKILAY